LLKSASFFETDSSGCYQSNQKRKRTRSSSPSTEHMLPSVAEESELKPKRKRPCILRINIPFALNSGLDHTNGSEGEEPNSLFSASDAESFFDDIVQGGEEREENGEEVEEEIIEHNKIIALRISPPIPGLYFQPTLVLPQELANQVVSFCMKTYFLTPADNQVMLFGRYLPPSDTPYNSSSGFPDILHILLDNISCLLRSILPPETYDLLFPVTPTKARQAIINLYQPGEGITPHVDLLGRYADGIVGVSFSSGCVMRFDRVNSPEDKTPARWDLYLPENSVIVLSKEARYDWTHGIDKRKKDCVSSKLPSSSSASSWLDRGVRMSVTFRWLLPGAEIIGDGS